MRLLIVSNRLPITIREMDGQFVFTESAGGLVSGLSAYLDSLKGSTFSESEYIWIGWPGIAVRDDLKDDLKQQVLKEFKAYPTFISENDMDMFYLGFCNKTIWPLFHYFSSHVTYEEEYWQVYKKVNETFCEAICEIARPDDIVWIQDYHLMLLPALLRKRLPDQSIGFFLHIPFPSYEIFRSLPRRWRIEILEGVLGSDLIGFHTHDDTNYFLRCVLRILGLEHDMGNIYLENRTVKVDTYPMGIDFKRFNDAASNKAILEEMRDIGTPLSGLKVVLSIDRLDYTKGILNRLIAYRSFLERNPAWLGKLVLLLNVVPSRVGIDSYDSIKTQIDEIIGNINGRFGNFHWTPVIYQYRFLPFDQLVALYNLSDIALVTPLRDGMNLIAKEYISTRKDQTGVLILSEFAGSSKELGEALIINPNNIEEIVTALERALEMPIAEQIDRNETMQRRLERYNVVRWANDIKQGIVSMTEARKRQGSMLISRSMDRLLGDFMKSRRRLIILDYDGTLVQFKARPQDASPDEKVLQVLKELSTDVKNEVVIITGRDRTTLDNWFDGLHIGLVAEHGASLKAPGTGWTLTRTLKTDWVPKVKQIMDLFVDRLPGSFVEVKEFTVTWHYRNTDTELGTARAKELIDCLVQRTMNSELQVVNGNKVVEVRNRGVNKGTASLKWLTQDNFEFVLAIGDDSTDEDLFKVLPRSAYSIKVGPSRSCARFRVQNQSEVLPLIETLLNGQGS